MKKLNLKQRLFLLIGLSVFSQALVIFVSLTKSNELLSTLHNVSDVVLPGTRDLSIADMHHDGMRAIVYEALYSSEVKMTDEIPSLVQEGREKGQDFVNLFKSLSKLELDPELIKAMVPIQEHVDQYAKSTNHLLDLIAQNKEEQDIKSARSKFLDDFKKVETDLEQLNEKFSAFASKQGSSGTDMISNITLWSCIGLFFTLIFSTFMFVNTKKVFESILASTEKVSETLTGLIDSVKNESNKVREASVEQAAAIQESVSALSEMSSMIAQTAQNVKLSLDTSQVANQKTHEGKEIMNRMSLSMESIQKSNAQLQDLSKVIEDINSKTIIINDIVFKTQLLSFNASIEAARAGQHGRGFAVVAEEVGNLAEMSGQAAKDIESLLSESRYKVKETLETIQTRVSDSNRVSQLAVQAFEDLAQNINEIDTQIQAINEATQQQEIGIQQTNVAMKQVDVTSQTNANSSMVALQQAEELQSKSEILTDANLLLAKMIRGHAASGFTFEQKTKTQSQADQSIAQKSSQRASHALKPFKGHEKKDKENNDALRTKALEIIQAHKNMSPEASADSEISADDPDFKKLVS